MKIQLIHLLYILFVVPLLLIWASNVYILDENNEKSIVFWQFNYVSFTALIIYTIITLQKGIEIGQKLFWKYFRPLVLLLFVGIIGTFLSSSVGDFTIKDFVQNIVLIFFSGLSLFMGLGLKRDVKIIHYIKICFVLFSIFGFFQFVLMSKDETILSILQKRPFVLSFYFLPIFIFYFLYFNPNKTLNLIIIPILTILIFLSGTRSGLILVIPMTLQYIKSYKKIVFFLTSILFLFFFSFNELIESSILTNSRVGKLETSRDVIWENALNEIELRQNYIFGNGLVRPNFSSSIEEIHSAHNTYIHLFYTYGLIGCIIAFSFLIQVLRVFAKYNIMFAISFLVITWVNDISIFPFDYSRIYEHMFIFFFIGSIIAWESKKFL